ncbi:hypothetical protein PMZ80_001071 [Knufia obscura]|uniref:Uncharacterized protein n=1 Tax=Knufia obscura TaxID=1635080 RepID=A0ABR0S2A3_9EURO|nr:hypothetical protein PMZ80_001071 [Knufia obscura]
MSSVETTTADTATDTALSTTVATTTPSTSSETSSAAPTTTTPIPSTTTLPPSTSIISAEPSTTYVAPTTTPAPIPTTVVTEVTSVVTQPPTGDPATETPVIATTIYSTQSPVTITPTASDASTRSETSSAPSSTRSALSASGSGDGSSKGLSSAATIAIAVIIPIAAVVGLIIFGLWFWRRRKAKKNAEELRKNEMAEYGFNPNNDPSLPVGAAVYTDGGSEGNDDSGYRGWGATTASNRKASTTLGSNSRVPGLNGASGMSDGGSQSGYGMQPSPSTGGSDGMSQDPLVPGYPDAATAGAVGGAAIGGAAIAGGARNRDSQAVSSIHRGTSNASSAYSGRGVAPSEASSDVPDMPRPYYQEEVPYNIYNEVQPGHGPYGDGTYGSQNDQPVIRDVQARRNTRIERAPTFPQQGGIAQNF